MTDNELKILISKYFEGETTLDEERMLRRILSDNPYPEVEEADEARAVMAFSIIAPGGKHHTPNSRQKPLKKTVILWLNCVAAVAVAALMIVPVTHTFHQSGECVAYVNGIKTEDIETVTAMMQTELEEAAMASDRVEADITAQWHEMANAFNSLN